MGNTIVNFIGLVLSPHLQIGYSKPLKYISVTPSWPLHRATGQKDINKKNIH